MEDCIHAVDRITRLRRRFRSLGVANFLVSRLSNVRYLCGYTGSNGLLLVTRRNVYFLTDGRYTFQANQEVKGAEIFIIKKSFIEEFMSNRNIRFRGCVGIESQYMTVSIYQTFQRTFPKSELITTTDVVEKLASVKNTDEIDAIRRAVAITDRVFESILEEIKPGVSEMDIAMEITYRHKKFGAEKDAFQPIVASGPRSALPHGIASNRKIKKGDFVTLDIGCIVDGYPSDMTRTIVVGKASDRHKEIYRIVQKAQQRGVEAVRAGAKCSDVDGVARRFITKAGYGDNFTHSLGHGLGLEVHAHPRLAAISPDRLKAGMTVTVEPGIYIEGFGGVRIEDDLIVKDDGAEVLNRSPRDLIEL